MRTARAWCVSGVLMLGPVADALSAEEAHDAENLSIFAGNLGNAFWTLLIFVLVILVLGRFAWGPILAGLQRREQFIRESLEMAKRDREAAEARLKEYEQKLQAARQEAGGIVEAGKRDGEAVKRRIEEDARAGAEAMIERAKREIGAARDAALGELYDRASELAMNMAGTVLKRQLAPEDQARLVQETLSELQQRRN